MKNSTKMALQNLGLDERTIKAIEAMPDLLNVFQGLIDHDERAEKIVSLIRENRSLSKEIAILRKTLAVVVSELHIRCPEFTEYNNAVEEIKNEIQ